MNADERVIKTYVWHEGSCFFVSTINRDSSSPYACGARYAETIVWAYNWELKKRCELLWTDSAGEGSIRAHQAMVERIHKTGDGEPRHDTGRVSGEE